MTNKTYTLYDLLTNRTLPKVLDYQDPLGKRLLIHQSLMGGKPKQYS